MTYYIFECMLFLTSIGVIFAKFIAEKRGWTNGKLVEPIYHRGHGKNLEQNYLNLLIIDYFSRRIEVEFLKRSVSETVVKKMLSIFARFGVPESRYY